VSDFHGLATRALRGLDPEDAHGLAITGLKLGLGPRGGRDDPVLATTLAGMPLPNPVGLAPGFDKNAEVFGPMLAAGFGFVECGTVTPKPQAGNPRPRLFRLTRDQAVINRMGFNNQGLEPFAARLAKRGPGVVGANFGANKDADDRIADYVTGLTRLWGRASYFTVNISSPNTPGLRALQTKAALQELLGRLAEARDGLPADGGAPMFLKVAPDLEDGEVETITEAVAAHGLAGIMVSNTTISRPFLRSAGAGEAGGLSGAPLFALSTQVLRRFAEAGARRLPLVGVGGVDLGGGAQANKTASLL
jgi:dihydroorotate dehydrogenase